MVATIWTYNGPKGSCVSKLWSHTSGAIEKMVTSSVILPQLNGYYEVGPGWKKW